MTTEVKLVFALLSEPFLLWNCRRNSCVEGGGNKNPICCNSMHMRIPLQVCLWLITVEMQGKNSCPILAYHHKLKSNLKLVNGVTCPSSPSLPGFTIKAAALSAEHSCYPSSKSSFQSRKNVMTKKDIDCLALYFHFPQTKSYNTGLFSLISIPGNPSATIWHASLTIPLLLVTMEPRASCPGFCKPHFYLQHT